MKTTAPRTIAALAAVLTAAASSVAADSVRPISFPTLVDSPEVSTYIHPIVIHQTLPDKLNTSLGKVPVGGDLQVYAVALELALGKDFSIIAVKDGYIEFNPDETLTEDGGWANLAAGVKYVFKRSDDFVASAKLVVELPTGSDDSWQGRGDGTVDPAIAFSKKFGAFQFNGTVGYIQPISDEDSASLYDSWHLSYTVGKFSPLVEVSHMHVTDPGDGSAGFDNQAGGAVPSIARFEGGDLVNLGATQSDDNPDFVTLAIGARIGISDSVNIGAAYEIPLTDEENSLLDSRITADLVIGF